MAVETPNDMFDGLLLGWLTEQKHRHSCSD